MKKFVVRCEEKCWNSKLSRLYYPGDTDEIHPLDPIAKYFEGWPPGTKVYSKKGGEEGSRVVGGEVGEGEEVKEVKEVGEGEEVMNKDGEKWASESKVKPSLIKKK